MAHEGKRHGFAGSGNTSIADVMKKNYSNLLTVEKSKSSLIPTNKYSATFNEPVIAESGDTYKVDTYKADTYKPDTYKADTYKKDEYSAKLNSEKSSKPYTASFENPTYPATFNEPVIDASGFNEDWSENAANLISNKVKGAYDFMSNSDGIDRSGADGSGTAYTSGPSANAAIELAAEAALLEDNKARVKQDAADLVDEMANERATKEHSLNATTYGVDDNKNLITPGNETSFIDSNTDRYGKSEENIEKADAYQAKLEAERAHIAQTSVTPDDIAITNQSEKDAATAVFMNNYSDDQVYQPSFDGALNNEILNTSDSDIKETVQKAEDLKESEVQKSIDILNSRAETDRLNNLKALKTLGLSDDNAPYVQDKEKGTYETENMTVFRPREIELENDALLKTQKIKDELEAEKQQAIADKLTAQDQFMSTLPGRDDIAGNNSYFVDSGQKLIQGDIKESMIDQEKGFVDVIAGTTAKDMTTTVREVEAERVAKERHNEQINNPTSDDVAKKGKLQLAKEEKAEKERLEAKRQNDRIDAIANKSDTAVAKEKARVDALGIGSGRGNINELSTERRKKETIAQRMKDQTNNEFAGGESEATGQTLMKDAKAKAAEQARLLAILERGDRENPNRFFGFEKNDPFSFSTLQYPSNVTNSQENGHYVLFYVNVQNKTKYDYQAGANSSVRVGDYYETIGQTETQVQGTGPQTGQVNTIFKNFIDTNLGARESGAGDAVAYQSQLLSNGKPGSKFWNNMTTLSKDRKSNPAGISQVFGKTTTRITDSVALYLPPGIKSDLSAQYDDSKTGMFGYLALSGKGLLQAMRDHDFDGATDAVFDVAGTLLAEAGKKFAAAAVSVATGGEGVQATFDKAFGQTLNPYIEVTFGSMGMRTFDYTFKFSPKSKKETEEAKAIIQLFRFHMAPELKNDSSPHRYMTLPSTFDIHYMYQSGVGNNATARENDYYNKIATCVLTNVGVDYTPNSEVQSFADGAPTQMSLALSFKETEMMTKQKINDGF